MDERYETQPAARHILVPFVGLMKTGDFTSVRFFFAKIEVNELQRPRPQL
jgi:hypothetical protein